MLHVFTVMYTLSYKCEFTRILKVGLMQLLLQISNKLNKIATGHLSDVFFTHTRTHARTHTHTHTRMHARTHTRTHARTHTRTNTHTETQCWFLWFTGTLQRRNVFILYKLYVLLPYTYPTPKLSPHRTVHFFFSPKKLTLYDLYAF